MIITNNSNILSLRYYLRYLIFGTIFLAIIGSLFIFGTNVIWQFKLYTLLFLIFTTLLFPVARYVMDSIVGFAYEDTVVISTEIGSLLVNFMIWAFSLFIAPFILVGITYNKIKATAQSK